MKPHFKKDVFGERKCWIVKTKPTKEAYLTNFDYRNYDNLPQKHTLKSIGNKQYLIFFFLAIPVFAFGYKLFELIIENNSDKFKIINNAIYLLLSVITILVVVYVNNKTAKPNKSLILTHDELIHDTFKISWKDVKGIYEIYHKVESSHVLNCIIIKTHNKRCHRIDGIFLRLSLSKLPSLISTYKWHWDKKSK